MPLNIMKDLPSFNTVAAGATASLNVPLGPTYRSIILKATNNGAAVNAADFATYFTGVRVKLNGKIYRDLSGADLAMLNAFHGYTQTAGIFPIDFAPPRMRTVVGEDGLAWGTADPWLQTFGIEVDIAAGATNPTLEAVAERVPIRSRLGWIIMQLRNPTAISATGQQEIPTLPRTNGPLQFLHFDISTAVMTGLEIEVDGEDVFDAPLDVLADRLRYRNYVPQTDWVHFTTAVTRRAEDVLPLNRVQDFRIKPTFSASGNLPIIMETLNAPAGVPEDSGIRFAA